MDATRRGLLATVPAAAVATAGCSLVSGSDSRDPPYVVENESDTDRSVALRVWKVGPVDPLEGRRDSFRKNFAAAAADGAADEADYEWRETYDLAIAPGSAATPLDSSSATGLLYVRAAADHGEAIGVWAEVGESPGEFFVDIGVYESGMGATVGEY